MSSGITQNFEYIAAHIEDYLEDGKLFHVFEPEDIKTILKLANLTSNNFIRLLEQSSTTFEASKLYEYTHDASVSINNFQDAISTLKSVRKYMDLRIFDGLIYFLDQKEKEFVILENRIQNLLENSREEHITIQKLSKIEVFKKSNEMKSMFKYSLMSFQKIVIKR